MLTIIVAMDANGLIGSHGVMPWSIKEDLQFFKETTLHKKLLVGHTTLKKLPKLSDRFIYGVSSKPIPNYQQKEVCWVSDPIAFMKQNQKIEEEIFVAGGSKIYELSLPYIDRLLITRIQESYQGDTYFPEVDFNQFELVKTIKLSDRATVYDYRKKD